MHYQTQYEEDINMTTIEKQAALEKQKASEILHILYTLKSDLNKTSTELDHQSDIINRSEKILNNIEEHISISSKIVSKISSTFSFIKSKIPLLKHSTDETLRLSPIEDNTAHEFSTQNEFDRMLVCIEDIKQQTVSHGNILESHNTRLENMLPRINNDTQAIETVVNNVNKI